MSDSAAGVFRGGRVISFSMFGGLVTGIMADAVRAAAGEEFVTELRLRVGRPLIVRTAAERKVARMPSGFVYTVTEGDIDALLAAASDYSVYAVSDSMARGYLTRRGVRIGVAGEGVTEGGGVLSVRNIRFLTVRFPRQVRGAAEFVRERIFPGRVPRSTLVISPPGGGKTTLLRELARISSARADTLIIDERGEIAAASSGVPTLDVGDADVLTGVPKRIAYENTVRAMSPEVIVTDELFGREDAEAVAEIVRSGVAVMASVHGRSEGEVLKSAALAPVVGCMQAVITLSPYPRAGTPVSVRIAGEAEA